MSVIDNAAELQSFLGYPYWLNFIGVGEDDGKNRVSIFTSNARNFRAVIFLILGAVFLSK